MRILLSTTTWLGLLFGSWINCVNADTPSAQQWLDRMALALDRLTYHGTLVYVRGQHIEAMRIWHRVDENGLQERLISLNGKTREVLRDSGSMRTILPDQKSVLITTRDNEPWYPFIAPEQIADLNGAYQFRLGTTDRVAGFDAQIVHVLPKDRYRYGYRLWLELKSGMLLKSVLLGQKATPLEQVMFTDIHIGRTLSDADLEPDTNLTGYSKKSFDNANVNELPPETSGTQKAEPWKATDLPDGFVLTGHHFRTGSHQLIEHLVYSDGLASVSVYVEREGERSSKLRGAGNLGAMNMFGHRILGFTVTVVGEVPSDTVKRIALSIRKASRSTGQ